MNRPRRTAVIAIHGVANQEPGETARAVARRIHEHEAGSTALSRESWEICAPSLPPPTERGDVASDLDPKSDGAGESFRTLVVRDLPIGAGRTVDVHEVAWADLSRPGTSPFAVLGALLGLVLALPAIGQREREAAKLPARLGWWLGQATMFVKVVMLPALFSGILLALSLMAVPCSEGRLMTVRIVFASANGLLVPPALAWFFVSRLAPGLREDGARTAWPWAFVIAAVGVGVGVGLYWLPARALAIVPAVEMIVVGAIVGATGLGALLSDERESRGAKTFVALPAIFCVVLLVQKFVLAPPAHEATVVARDLLYATMYAIEWAYIVTSIGFTAASVCALGALLPWACRIFRAAPTRYTAVHAVRTIAMSHALPFVVLLLLALPLVSAVLALLANNHLLPEAPVSLHVLGSLERFKRPVPESRATSIAIAARASSRALTASSIA